jgi:hypothetical protein
VIKWQMCPALVLSYKAEQNSGAQSWESCRWGTAVQFALTNQKIAKPGRTGVGRRVRRNIQWFKNSAAQNLEEKNIK